MLILPIISSCAYLQNKYSGVNSDYLRYLSRGKAGVGYDVFVYKGYAYVINNDGADIFDIRQPENLKKVGQIKTEDTGFGIFIDKHIAYVLGDGLNLADISDPSNPQIIGKYKGGGTTSQVCVSNSYAYISSYNSGLQIIDIKNPKNPALIGQFNNGGSGASVEILNNTVFFADSQDGLELIDVSNPPSPRLIKTIPGTSGAWDIMINKNRLYLGCHGNGILIFDILEDNNIKFLGSFQDGGEALGVWGDDKYLFVADNFEFEVLDVSNPSSPKKVDEIKGVNGLHDLFVDGKYIYLADGLKGLIVLEFKGY